MHRCYQSPLQHPASAQPLTQWYLTKFLKLTAAACRTSNGTDSSVMSWAREGQGGSAAARLLHSNRLRFQEIATAAGATNWAAEGVTTAWASRKAAGGNRRRRCRVPLPHLQHVQAIDGLLAGLLQVRGGRLDLLLGQGTRGGAAARPGKRGRRRRGGPCLPMHQIAMQRRLPAAKAPWAPPSLTGLGASEELNASSRGCSAGSIVMAATRPTGDRPPGVRKVIRGRAGSAGLSTGRPGGLRAIPQPFHHHSKPWQRCRPQCSLQRRRPLALAP